MAVVGAGLSVFAGIPLGSGLSALVWQAIDSDRRALEDLAKRLGIVVTFAKDMIGDDPDRLKSAYELIRSYPKCRASFQNGFKFRNDERVSLPSAAHEALARLFHEHNIELVISLNWDTLFEAAYRRLSAHADELQVIPPRFAIIAPNAVAKALRRGAQLAYPNTFGPDWPTIATCLAYLSQTDKQAVSESIGTQISAVARSLSTHQANLYEDSDKFIDVIEEIRPGISKAIFEAIDVKEAAENWPQLKRGPKKQRQALKRLLELASQSTTPLSEVARDIRRHRVHQENKVP